MDDALSKNRYVFGIIDVKGAQALKAIMPQAFVVFVKPGSLSELSDRLRVIRAGISDQELERRLATAADELAVADSFDASIDNVPGRFDETIGRAMRLL